MADTQNTGWARRSKGFRRTSALLQSRIKGIGAKRGFAVSRLLTHWAEVVGPDMAGSTQPVEVTYGRKGIGATLTLLVKGAEAPMIEMQKDRIRETVNACYGYNAIQKIRLTQTAATGFSEASAEFEPASSKPDPDARQEAAVAAADVEDPGLRAALEALGAHILSPTKQTKRSDP